jgi:hypothetical protein
VGEGVPEEFLLLQDFAEIGVRVSLNATNHRKMMV